MSSDPNIFDCLLDPSEIFVLYQKLGSVLKNDRDLANEQIRGQALHNTMKLLQQTSIIQKSEEGYTKLIKDQTPDSFFSTLIAAIKNTYAEEVAIITNCNKHYDEIKSQFFIYVNDIPLKYMGLAMLMEQTGEFDRIQNREYFIGIENYRDYIKKKPIISIDELQKKLRRNIEVGEQAEKFALEYEANRLKQSGINKEPLSVSSVDVMAGYDMVSYESKSSKIYDRFIEVKAVSNIGFFWSKNEVETAKIKAENYYLYLVDLSKINDIDYAPEMIRNPAENIIDAEGWYVEAQSYRVKHI